MISDAERLKETLKLLKENPEIRIIAAKIKMQQMNEISAEIIKLKQGVSKHECYLRNYLQVFSGEMEIFCGIDITKHVESILFKIKEGFTDTNWNHIVDECLEIYRLIMNYCK